MCFKVTLKVLAENNKMEVTLQKLLYKVSHNAKCHMYFILAYASKT